MAADCGEYSANVMLREAMDALDCAELPIGATDDELCAYADRMARRAEVAILCGEYYIAERLWGDVCGELPARGANANCARFRDVRQWRRRIRLRHAQAVEAAAIKAGCVSRSGDVYCSDDGVKRWRGAQFRNERTLKKQRVRNTETGQESSLFEIAQAGVSNPVNRKNELMTRIEGLDRVASDLGVQGYFVTVTCPSKYHSVSAGGEFNKKWEAGKLLPIDAHKYLVALWSRVRAKWDRQNLRVFGLRVSEPHADGCPHWHLMMWGHDVEAALDVLSDYSLREDGDEPGASERRCYAVKINRGGAAAYCAKYISKNINDGINGNAERVRAWASCWRIRQFQQFGGAPIGVWRELRRIKALQGDAPERLRMAWLAAHRDGERRADYAQYIEAQGGVYVGRGYQIALHKILTGEIGAYGDLIAPVSIGVDAGGYIAYSARAVWEKL